MTLSKAFGENEECLKVRLYKVYFFLLMILGAFGAPLKPVKARKSFYMLYIVITRNAFTLPNLFYDDTMTLFIENGCHF